MEKNVTEKAPAAKPAKNNTPVKAVKPPPPQMLDGKELKPYENLKELVEKYKTADQGVSRSMLKVSWWLGYHVDQVLNHAAYGSCGMDALAQALFADLTPDEAKRKTKSLYLYARFNQGYKWEQVEKRLIANRIPLRVIERLLTIKDVKVRTAVEDALIAGKTVEQALIDTGVKKALELPAAAADGASLGDEGETAGADGVVGDGEEIKSDKKATTPAANKVLQALAQAEAHGNNFRAALLKLEKALKPYESCTDGKDRTLVGAELARVMDELLTDFGDTLTEAVDAVKRNQT